MQQSLLTKVEVRAHSSSQQYLIANTKLQDFRATLAKAAYDSERNTIYLAPDVAELLLVETGDSLRVLAHKSERFVSLLKDINTLNNRSYNLNYS